MSSSTTTRKRTMCMFITCAYTFLMWSVLYWRLLSTEFFSLPITFFLCRLPFVLHLPFYSRAILTFSHTFSLCLALSSTFFVFLHHHYTHHLFLWSTYQDVRRVKQKLTKCQRFDSIQNDCGMWLFYFCFSCLLEILTNSLESGLKIFRFSSLKK